MPELTTNAILVITGALALGGLMKGATGAGTPVIAVPVMAAFFDARLAVVIMVIPNLASNIWQVRQYRQHLPEDGFAWRYAIAGALGVILGTVILATISVRLLGLTLAGVVLAYIALRLARPDFRVNPNLANRIVWPVGLVGGFLQGAAGISAPVSVTFLNAMKMERPVFIITISMFFIAMVLTQAPSLLLFGLITPELALLGTLALVPMFLLMPVGAWLARYWSQQVFDRVTLLLLAAMALRLILASPT